MKSLLDHFAAVLGAFTIALIIVSVTHELGYFTIVGRHFQTLLTTTDYLVNSIVWLPGTVFFIWGWGEWDKLRAAKESLQNEKLNLRNWKFWIWFAILIVLILGVASTVTWPPSQINLISLITVIFIGWAWLYKRFRPKIDGINGDLKPIFREFLLLAPPVLIVFFFFGLANAGSDMENRDPYHVYYKQSNRAELKVFLRSFQMGILVRDFDSNFIEFHPWTNVLRIERAGTDRSNPLGCVLFELLCPFERVTPPLP